MLKITAIGNLTNDVELKKMCIRDSPMVLLLSCLKRHPGVAKFGIALEWGSRGLEFESQHSDQKRIIRTASSLWGMRSDFFFLLKT